MTGLVLLIAAFSALTALAVYLDHRGLDVGNLFGTDPRTLVDRAHSWRMDLREPGEAFCADCPDHEGCMQGIPCELVQHLHREAS